MLKPEGTGRLSGWSRIGEAGAGLALPCSTPVRFPQINITVSPFGEFAGCNCSLSCQNQQSGMVDVRLGPWGKREKEKVLRSFNEGYMRGRVTRGRRAQTRKRLAGKTDETNFLIL